MYPAKTSQGIPRPLDIFLRPPLPQILKPSGNSKAQNQESNPITPCLFGKRKGKAESTIINWQNHATDIKRTIYQHAKPCMSKPIRKSHMKYVTCKYSCWSCLILLLLAWSLLSFAFLILPLLVFSFLSPKLESSKKPLSVQEWERERIMRDLQN